MSFFPSKNLVAWLLLLLNFVLFTQVFYLLVFCLSFCCGFSKTIFRENAFYHLSLILLLQSAFSTFSCYPPLEWILIDSLLKLNHQILNIFSSIRDSMLRKYSRHFYYSKRPTKDWMDQIGDLSLLFNKTIYR